MLEPELPPVFQVGLDLVQTLAMEGQPQTGRHEHGRQRKTPGGAPAKCAGLPAPPFAPPFDQATVGDAAERQVIEMPAQVIRQGGRIAVTLRRLPGQALRDDVGQTHAHPGIVEVPPRTGRTVDEGTRDAKCVAQQQAQRIEIGPMIHGFRDRLAEAHGLHGVLLLGGHPAGRSPQPVGNPLTGLDRLPSQVKVEEHGQTVARDQDIRRLDVHVDQPVHVGLVERVRQAGGDPADGMDVGCLIQVAAVWTVVGGWRGRGAYLDPAEDLEEMAPLKLVGGDLGQRLEDSSQAGPAQVGHAERPEPAVLESLLREQRDDMCMLQPGQ